MVEEMMQPEMVLDTVEIINGAIEKGVLVNLIINNRAGGDAPLVAREIAERFVRKPEPKTPQQKNLSGA
jgi:hypothetical protein